VDNNRLKNISSLNSIRAITALIIVIYHAKFILWCGGNEYIAKIGLNHWLEYPLLALDLLSSNGEPIVVCFFILSGFVITHSFRKSNYAIIQFYAIRLIRIFIPFIFSIFLSIATLSLVHWLNPGIFENSIREYNSRLIVAWNNLNLISIIKSIFFIKNKEYIGLNFVYWSLLHEVIFYLIYPIYDRIKMKGRIALTIVLTGFYALFQNHLIYYQIFFLVGILIYDNFSKIDSKPIFSNRKLYILLLPVLYVIMTINFIMHWKIPADLTAAILSIFAFDFVISYKLKWSGIVNYFAEFSYTLYLVHLPILLLTYCLLALLTNQVVFYERYYYYTGVIIAVIGAKMLFFSEKFSLFLIKKLKENFKSNTNK
jgi:peptidoglycan/LPS O-acetylase OafA/YrhL